MVYFTGFLQIMRIISNKYLVTQCIFGLATCTTTQVSQSSNSCTLWSWCYSQFRYLYCLLFWWEKTGEQRAPARLCLWFFQPPPDGCVSLAGRRMSPAQISWQLCHASLARSLRTPELFFSLRDTCCFWLPRKQHLDPTTQESEGYVVACVWNSFRVVVSSIVGGLETWEK